MNRILSKLIPSTELELARKSLLYFTLYTFPDYDPNWHHINLCEKLDRFVSGEIKRLMVFMPPRHGKSELVSRRLPAYILGRNPDTQIISASYAADLARHENRSIQRIIDGPEYREVFPKTQLFSKFVRSASDQNFLRNTDEFEVMDHNGFYKSAGVGGGIAGRGFNFGIVDDPVKDRQDANSKVMRDSVWEWWTDVFYTRQEKDASILLTMTRWHDDDPAGRLLKQMKHGGDQWEIAEYPAIIEEDMERPHGDPREVGEALWPNKKNKEDLEQIKRNSSHQGWSSLFQQRPHISGGAIFKRYHFRYFLESSDYFELHNSDGEVERISKGNTRMFQIADTALKEKEESKYTVIGTFILCPGHRLLVYDMYRERLAVPKQWGVICDMLERYPHISFMGIEDKASGIGLIQRGIDEGKSIKAIPAIKDKITRAEPASVAYENGMIFHRQNINWLDIFESELLSFPVGKYDDQVDVISYAWKISQDMPSQASGPIKLHQEKPRVRSKYFQDYDHYAKQSQGLTPNRPIM